MVDSENEITITGDKSLSRRDFSRVTNPLKMFGATLKSKEDQLPVKIRGSKFLRPIEYFEKQKIYVASGNAKASKGNFSIKAERITAFLGKTKNSNITDIEANGNVIIGHNSDAVSDSNYANVIGHNITGTATQRSRIGAGSNYVELDHSTSGNNWANTSDVRVKENIVDSDLGLGFVNKLRAVKYEERPKKDWPQEFLSTSGSEDLEEKSQKVFDGFIAQEVKAIVDESKTTFSAWQIDENNKKQQLQYAMFVVPLVKAVQELSAKVTELESKLGE